jgi:hypothetical protein
MGKQRTMGPIHHYELFDGTWLISLSRPGVVTDREWDDFLDAIRRSPDLKYVIGVSLGTVTLNSVLRKKAADLLKERGIFAVVITDDKMVRGVATAVSWVGAKVKAFSWEDIDAALEFVGASPDAMARMRKSIMALKASVEGGR